jgi:hypothetical protein
MQYLLLPKISEYFKDKVAGKENYVSFGLFMPFIYMVPLFTHPNIDIAFYKWLFIIKTLGTLLCIGLLLNPYWPATLQKYASIYWHFTIFYCLPFTFTLLFLINGYSTVWLINISLAITLLTSLVNWLYCIMLLALSIPLGVLFYWSFIGTLPSLYTENLLLLSYTCLASMLIGLLFARRKEQTFNSLLLQKQHLSESQKATRQELASTLTYRENLLKELNPDEIALFDDMTTAYIQQAIYHITDYLKLDVTNVSLEGLQKELIDLYKGMSSDKLQLIFKRNTSIKEIEADLPRLKQVMMNAIDYVQQHNKNDDAIYITFEDAQLGHTVAHMPNYVRKLQGLKVTISTNPNPPATQPLYKIDLAKASTWLPQYEEEYPLIESARIIDAHYGFLAHRLPHTQVYIFPVKLREVRGKVMELIKDPTEVDPEELRHPVAIDLEKKLMAKLKDTEVDIKTIEKALEIIKKYHAGVKRKSGEPFFTHPMTVALITLEYSQDQAAILGALLHDTVEDTSLSMKDIERTFGKTVAFLVAKSTNLEDHKRRINLSDKENITRIANYEDPRAALIKLADRLHNMRTIKHQSALRKRQISQETLDEFVPLAHKLGLTAIAQELEKLSRAVLNAQ